MTKVFETPAALIGAEGTALGPSDWLLVDQARVDGFAEVTGDHQWIHVDVERAKAGPVRRDHRARLSDPEPCQPVPARS